MSKPLYTEEQLIKAIELAREITDGTWDFNAEDISGRTEVCTYDWEMLYTNKQIKDIIDNL